MNANSSPTGFIPPDPAHLAGLFPGYQIVRLIACGGMGAVYEAIQIALERSVAIKILPREFTTDESFRTGFQAEARAMARLNHPNLISVYDFGEVDGMLYIIMEYVPGFSLFEAANGQAILQGEVVPLVSSICHGLAHAHDNGIIHRDIKPANILLNLNNEPKIGDFGLARPLENQLREGEEIFGTPGYTAPEVLQTPYSIDHRADIFSLGVLLHELLTGLLPDADPRPASAICHCDPRFDLVIRKATHSSPNQRYDSANEIATEIGKISTTAGPRILKTATPAARRLRGTPAKYRKAEKSKATGFITFMLLVAACIVAYRYFAAAEVNGSQKIEPSVTETHSPTTPQNREIVAEPSQPVPIEEDPEITSAATDIENLIQWQDSTYTWDEGSSSTRLSVISGDINGRNDRGIFKYQVWHGDGLFTIELDPITSAPSTAKAGIMIRESLEDDARNLLLARNSSGETILQLRANQGNATAEYARLSGPHRFLRLHRSGDQVTAVASVDKNTWSEIGTLRLQSLRGQIFIGFAAASATHSSTAPLYVTYTPLAAMDTETAFAVEGSPPPRADMNELFRRARGVMKDLATPLHREFREKIQANNETYIRQSKELINVLSEGNWDRYTHDYNRTLTMSETGGFIGIMPLGELAEIPAYLDLHQNSVEHQRLIQKNHAVKMNELAEIYVNGINNQIQRSTDEGDVGAVQVLEAEKMRVLTLPYYFRSLME